tara:strand:+ start:39 stop:440 length:402 start_codon:yes stop_codon:yes gene_type:complete
MPAISWNQSKAPQHWLHCIPKLATSAPDQRWASHSLNRPLLFTMAIAGPDGVDAAIKAGVDLDGSPIPEAMLTLYNQVMDLESQRARSGVLKSMRNRVVKTGAKHFDQETLNQRLQEAGWEGLKDKEVAFFYG